MTITTAPQQRVHSVALPLAAFALIAGAGGGYLYGHQDVEACQDAVAAHEDFGAIVSDGLKAAQTDDVAGMMTTMSALEALDADFEQRYGTESLTVISDRCPG